MADGFGNPFLKEENKSADPFENPFLKKKKDGFSNPFVSDLPAETAIPPVVEVSDPSLTPDLPPVDPTGGFRSPTSGVTEANALMAQKIAEENRARQIANQPNVTEMDSVFYPKTFDPAVTGQNALETERQRLATVMGEAGPTIAKTELNLNPAVSNVSGVPGNYQFNLPVGSTPISDADAAEMLSVSNTYQAPNNALSRGYVRMLGVTNILAQQLGIRDTGQFIDNMQQLNRISTEAPKEVQDGLRAITAEGNTVADVYRAMKENPGAILSVVGESIPQMIPALAAATGVTFATGGNIFAGAMAIGATSGATEFGNVLDEEMRSSGVDLNDDAAVELLLQDKEFWGRARERGARRGIAIGLFDALSMGIAGKLVNVARVRGGGRAAVTGAAAGELGAQGLLGGLGEAMAQAMEVDGGFRDGINLGEVGLETVAEFATGGAEVAAATIAGGDPVALAAQQTIRDIDNAEFTTTPEQVAIERLSPQEMPLEAQIVDLQMRLRAVGQDKLAGTYGTWLDRLDTLKPEQLKFLKEKVEAEERKSAGVASLQPRVENVFESFLAQDPKEKAQLDQALEDTRTGPVLREMAKNMQLIGDRLHELGYNYNDVSSDPNAPQEVKNARNYLAHAGIAMRLIKQLNANVKGFKGNRSVSDEDINKTIGRLQSVVVQDVLPRIEGAPQRPTVQTELPQPVAPTIDTDVPVAPAQVETNPIKTTAAQNVARASVIEGAVRSMFEMDDAAANSMLDELEVSFPGIKTEILNIKKSNVPTAPESGPSVQGTVPVAPDVRNIALPKIQVPETPTEESFSVAFGDSVNGLTVSSNDTTANISTVEVRSKEVTGVDGVTYKSIFDPDLPFGSPVNLVVKKNGKLSVSTASKVKGDTNRPNFVAATVILPLDATDAQISAAVKESRKQWSANYKGVTTSEAVPNNPKVETKPPAMPEQPTAPTFPSVETDVPVAPAVQETAPPQPAPPVAEEAPTVNPQEAEPVGREVPSKPVTSVQTPDGQANFNVQGRVIELADLKQATGDLQPRDRSRKESTALAKERAGSMFNPERLLDDPTSGSGAPIIARDGTVMSGNGRVLTMQEVYASQSDSLASYRSALETAGISTEGFSQPVFVRQLTDDMTVQELKRFADLSNTEAQAQMSMTERATRDSTRLTDSGIIDLYRGDFDINAAQNRGFVSEYAKKILSPTEQGAFVNSKGEISQEGISRVKNAILASAFDNPDTLATMLESSDENIKAISSAFMAAAPKFAQLKKQVANGRTEAQFDITPQLADMANLVSRLRRDGVKLQDYYSQSDMLSAPDPEVQSLVRAFYNEGLTRANSAKAMKEFLDFYTTEALQKESGGLLPDQTTASDIIESGRQRTEEKRNETKRQEQPGLELAASSNVERNDARSKQVPKRRNAKSGERTEAVKPAAERKVDDARSESAVEESVEGVVELRNAESTSPANADTREENTRGTKAGRVTIAQSQTLRQSLYRDAFADAGFEVDTAVNLPITRQYKILSDLVTKKFGLSFVEKPQQGAGYDQVNALLDAYHNLQWMTHTMAMPNTAIGLDGTLGLALPQNAWGGYLAAYVNQKQTDPDTYQSDINPVAGPVILMPGRSNSFAHEWGHALDYHILDRIGNDWGRGVTGRIRTNLAKGEMVYADNAPQNVVEAMGDLMNVMFMENAEVSAEIMKIEGDVARLQAKQDKRTSGKPIKKLADMKEQLRQLREGSSKKRISKSQYRKDAETFAANNKSDAKYWTRPTEMFARAFEAYVAHNVEAAGGNTEFIAFENEAYEMAMDKVKGGDDRLALTYPNDPDRMRIFMAMDRLMDELRADMIQEGTVAEAPGDTDMIDAQADFYQEVDRTKKERIGIIEDQKRAWNEHRVMRQKVRDRPQRYKSALARFQDTAGVVIINTKRGILFNIASRYKDNPKAKALIESVIARVANDPGSTDNRVTVSGGTFEEAVRGAARRYAGVWATLLEKHQLNSFSALDNKELRLFLTSDETAQTNAPEKIKRAAGDIRNKLLNPMYDYMRKNGLDVNYLPEGGFMPRMMDALLVADSKEKFVKGLPGEKKRGAKALYSDVIYENELGVVDVNDAEQAAALVKMARKLEGSLDESTAEAAAELKFKLKQIERESAKLNDPEVDPGDVEASIMQLQEEAAELHEQLYEELRDPYSTEAANDWYDRVVRRQVGDISRHGVQGSFAKSRKLPPEADTYMVDFYLDPVEAITNYISGVTRKVEFEKRFGTKNVPKGKRKRTSGNSIDPAGNVHDFMSYVSEEMAAAGMKEHEVRQIQKIVEVVTGTGAQTDYALETVLNTLNTFGTMALLPRAVISSIAEPMTAAITTGSVTDGFRTFAYSLDEFATFVRGRTARERKQYYKQLGSILGVIDLPESGEVIANRVGGTAEEDSKNAMRLGRFFFRTGLVSITNAQRRGSLRVGIRYLGQLGEQYTKPSSPRMKDRAREVLQDFGVRPEDMDQFAEFVMNLEKNEKGMYEIDSIIDRSGELSDMGEILALATRRFTDQTIQDPKIVDRPMYAESPVGRVVFGIQSFVAAFTRNVLIASAKRVQREYENRGLASAIPYAGWNVALPLGSLFITHTLVSAVREMLLNPDKWEEEKEADNLEMYLLTLGLTRSGFTGRMDPLVNAMTSLKYQSDLSNMMVGASGAYYLKAVQRMAGIRPEFIGGSNSPNTVSAEYQFARGTYDMVVPTALSLLASHPGLGGAASALSGVSAAAFSSPAVKHYVLRSVIKQLYDEEYRPGRAGRKTKSDEKKGFSR